MTDELAALAVDVAEKLRAARYDVTVARVTAALYEHARTTPEAFARLLVKPDVNVRYAASQLGLTGARAGGVSQPSVPLPPQFDREAVERGEACKASPESRAAAREIFANRNRVRHGAT